MEDVIYKTWTRLQTERYVDYVRHVERFFAIIASNVLFLITILVGYLSTLVGADERAQLINDWFGRYSVAVWWMWVVGSLALISNLESWASHKLLSSTEFGRDIYEGFKKLRIWRNLTFILFVLQVMCVGAVGISLGGVGDCDECAPRVYIWFAGSGYLVYRGTFLFTVYYCMKELEKALVAESWIRRSG